ncbi:MAG: ATP-binding protein [Rickettsiales bacterium]|nr:ATP-binding protein [Rickettsiales bacterium]
MMIMVLCVVSIVLTTIILSVIGYQSLRRGIVADLNSVAIFSLDRNAALLDYIYIPNIRRKAFRNLAILSRDKNIALVCMYNSKYELAAYYHKGNTSLHNAIFDVNMSDDQFSNTIQSTVGDYDAKCRSISDKAAKGERLVLDVQIPVYSSEGSGLIRLAERIAGDVEDESVIADSEPEANAGRILLQADLDHVQEYLREQLITSFLIILGVIVLCYLLAMRMQKYVSSPILRLAEVARHVSIYKDYSLRIEQHPHFSYEMNQLMESFNSMLSDIEDRDSRLMRKNIELERAKESAEAASVAKSQFLANISHELRTPLNAVIGFSSIIMNQLFGKIGNSRYLDYGKDIHDSGVHLLEVINDILDLSKAEAGKLTLRFEPFDIREAIEKCSSILSERAREGEVKVYLHFPKDVPFIVADRVRFIQIMLNLMSNAVKFTEEGGRVDVDVMVDSSGSDVNYFTICVRDTGMGMRDEDISLAFQSFGQVDGGLDRKYEGTGLGLPLTKKLVELHNASIRMESEVGKGTQVTLRFTSDSSLMHASAA